MVGSELGAFVGGKVGRTVEALVDVKAVTVELNVKPLQASTVYFRNTRGLPHGK